MVRRICRRPVGSGDRIRHYRWAFRCCGKTGRSGFRSWTLHAALKHFAAPEFWHHYRQLPAEVRRLADQKFELLKADPHHSSIRLKKVGQFWTARIGLHYRALLLNLSRHLAYLADESSVAAEPRCASKIILRSTAE